MTPQELRKKAAELGRMSKDLLRIADYLEQGATDMELDAQLDLFSQLETAEPETRPVSEFGSSRKSGDGLQGHCKDCMNAYARELNHRLHGGKEVAELQRGGAREKVTSDKNVPLSQITSEALVAALRSRGWTVTCTRTVEEAL